MRGLDLAIALNTLTLVTLSQLDKHQGSKGLKRVRIAEPRYHTIRALKATRLTCSGFARGCPCGHFCFVPTCLQGSASRACEAFKRGGGREKALAVKRSGQVGWMKWMPRRRLACSAS